MSLEEASGLKEARKERNSISMGRQSEKSEKGPPQTQSNAKKENKGLMAGL